MARQRVYITQGVYSSTPFTGYGCGESVRGRESLVLSNAARGLVYSCASDDNVHAALNLPLLPPSSREPGRGGSLFHPSFLPLHYIIFHSFRRTFPSVALRSALFALTLFFLFSFVCVDLLFLFSSFCSYFMRAGVPSRRGESMKVETRQQGMRRYKECLYIDNTDIISARKLILKLIWP